MKDVILTGIRSNDEPTLGNYLGAFVPMVELQKRMAGDYQLNMFVPDLHSFTTPIDHAGLYDRTLKNLKYFVAAGLDIDQADTYIYRQSYVSAHSELAWILSCFTGFGEMRRMTQFKEKTHELEAVMADRDDLAYKSEGQYSNNTSVGLFNYPILMAADIVLYGAKWVPVGDDQKQHIEMTRDIALRLNTKFGQILTPPEPWQKQFEFMNLDNGVRIRSLTNPAKKMSKSIADPRGTILLNDDPHDAAKKIMGATTDSLANVHFDWDTQPGVTNLLQILARLSSRDQVEVNAEWDGVSQYGDLKSAVATAVREFLVTFQARYNTVGEDALLAKLETSEVAMREVAGATLLRVQQAVGLRPGS